MIDEELAISKELIGIVPARVAERYSILPVRQENGILYLFAPQELPREIKEELKIILGKKLVFVSKKREEITELIAKKYGVGAGVIETLTHEHKEIAESVGDIEVIDQDKNADASITKLVNELLLDALKHRASDIHIEPFEHSFCIRYRVDGLLQVATVPEKIISLVPSLISRIKIMAKLDIGEKRLPQDGRIKIKRGNGELDLRVSVLPSSFGEAIVIRILKSLELLQLGELGFDQDILANIRVCLKKPHGIILITGPTGSGKTTTLYACLKELKKTQRKILTIEDPVEYKLSGIIQMQVNLKIDFTFARALRHMLRHDPDCLMVGEIRDGETAEIAIRSALTGHLVFSTLHTNDAPSAVTRLLEMGIEPYLVASSLEAVIAQRLVRKFCYSCKVESRNSCGVCGGSGYYGRTVISEMMVVTEGIRDLILERKSRSLIRKLAFEQGLKSLFEDGINKVKQGITSEEEIRRISSV